MTKCKHCGFDSTNDSLVAEGAPCGINGCSKYFCCYEAWIEHCGESHQDYYKEQEDNQTRRQSYPHNYL